MAGNATYSPPLAVISETDHGGSLLTVDIIGLFIAIVFVAARVFLPKSVNDYGFSITKDDVACYAATVLIIVESSIVWVAQHVGNGKKLELLSSQALVKVQQYQYAIDILYILGLFCTRASIILLLQRIQNSTTVMVWRSGLAFLSACTIASVFMVALKCNLGHPWIQYNAQCTHLLARWYIIEITGVAMEIGLLAAVVYLVHSVQMRRNKKIKILFLFGTRVFVIIFALLRIAHLSQYIHSADPTFSGIPAAIYAQAQLHSSLATCTTPLLKSFILEFSTHTAPVSRHSITSSRTNRMSYGMHTNVSHASGRTGSHFTDNPPKNMSSSGESAAGRAKSEQEPWTLGKDYSRNASITHSPRGKSKSQGSKSDGIEVSRSFKVNVGSPEQ